MPVPSTAAPSRNVTVPVGVPEPAPESATVAVNVTLPPTTDGLTDEMRLVVVAAFATTCETAVETLPR